MIVCFFFPSSATLLLRVGIKVQQFCSLEWRRRAGERLAISSQGERDGGLVRVISKGVSLGNDSVVWIVGRGFHWFVELSFFGPGF